MKHTTYLQILDSRANPTIQGRYADEHVTLTAAVPSGASTGVHEAHELRDDEDAYAGKGVQKAVANAQQLSDELDWSQADVTEADKWMREQDGTDNKSALGANALLAVSLLQARVQAHQHGKEVYELISELAGQEAALPLPFANIINGGEHAQNGLQLQEFMIVPVHAQTFAQATQQVAETYHVLKGLIADRYSPDQTALGDEGGFAPMISDAHEACRLLVDAMQEAGHEMGIAIDAAASEFYSDDGYEVQESSYLDAKQLIDYYTDLVEQYPIISLEDPFDQDDYASFSQLREALEQTNCQVVGDDLTVTNPDRIRQAAKEAACDCLLLKINQIGTVSESLDAARTARDSGWSVMVSHRSGETEDSFISDLAVGLGCGQIKIGAPARGERTAKYNRLLCIEATSGLSLAPHAWTKL